MRLWGKDQKQDNRKNIWIEHLNIDTGNWFQVFSACLGKMIAIQTACSEQVVKEQDWNVDFSEGVILFGNQKYPIQFIGSEAASSNTWLWGKISMDFLHKSFRQPHTQKQWENAGI